MKNRQNRNKPTHSRNYLKDKDDLFDLKMYVEKFKKTKIQAFDLRKE